MSFNKPEYKDKCITVMGLGLNGGGLASALYFARHGARVTVTDLKSPEVLGPSLKALKDFPVRFVLERHEADDFIKADLVIKNPAVPSGSPYLKLARDNMVPVETDLSLFFKTIRNPVIAVTGSKGKSTTASAVFHGLKTSYPLVRLGGNITISPLSFIEDLGRKTPVVLELSSWQLADLEGIPAFKPHICIMTSIMPDHQDRYPDMAAYIKDKKIIFKNQDKYDKSIFNFDDPYQSGFDKLSKADCYFYAQNPLPGRLKGAWLDPNNCGVTNIGGREEIILPRDLMVPGRHNRLNLLGAGLALALFGLKPPVINGALSAFPGVEHRLEFCGLHHKISFYNDSAATIPQATAAAIAALEQPLCLITGGTDKNLDFTPLLDHIRKPAALYLLQGSATAKMIQLFDAQKIPYKGPYDDLERAVHGALDALPGGGTVLFSPGCASFGMFLNEFDRGNRFKAIVKQITG